MKRYYNSNPIKLFARGIPLFLNFRKIETYSRDELEAYQLQKLINTLFYAGKHVPYYRKLFSSIGFEPADFKSLNDITKLPYLTKDILRASAPADFLSDESMKMSVATIKTSGSTGVPLEFSCDLTARAAKYAIAYHAFSEAGYQLGKSQFILKNCFYANKAFAYSRLTNRVSMHAYMNSKENARNCDILLKKHPPYHVLAHPNALLEFGKSIADPRFTFRKLRGISTMSEPLTPALRQQLENCLGAPVFDYYSNNESSLIAYQTKNKGYLFGEHFSFPEIIPSDNNPNTGELVTTTFFSFAMPLIRYRNADIVEFENSDSGGCYFRRIRSVCGRTAEAIVLPDGNSVRIFNFMHSQLQNVQQYQIEQTDRLHLYINLIRQNSEHPVNMEDIINELRFYVGNNIQIDVKIVDSLKKDISGKTPRIINSIGK